MSTAPLVATNAYTAEDLERFSAQGYRYELINGELIEMSPAGARHGNVTARLAMFMEAFIEERELGEYFAAETGFLIRRKPDTVLAPDWSFIHSSRVPDPLPESFAAIIPDLIVETRSPDDSAKASAAKIARWLEAGVRVALEVEPQRCEVTVYYPGREPLVLGSHATLELPELLPGFSLPLSRVFRPVRRSG